VTGSRLLVHPVWSRLGTDRNRQLGARRSTTAARGRATRFAVFAKLQVADRTQAILRARDAGLGHP
jgi:hypothetical protein